MNIRHILIGCVIFLIGAAAAYLYIYPGGQSQDDSASKTKQTVRAHYTNSETGMIHAYPDKPDSQYLSESAGQYMQYLVKTGEGDAFEEYFDQFKEQFLVQKDGQLFIKWELKDDTSVNALIDDMRIAAALNNATKLFAKPDYANVAEQIVAGIRKNEHNDGLIVDYYDWKSGQPAERLTLSYLTGDFFKLIPNAGKEKQLLEEAAMPGNPFFPEYYDVKKQAFVSQDEVHMVDQLLIAINRKNLNIDSPAFLSWLKEKWDQDGKIYGRYDRASGEQTVAYESPAVYDYMQRYLDQTGEHDSAKAVGTRMKKIVPNRLNKDSHFFDYMHYRLMLVE